MHSIRYWPVHNAHDRFLGLLEVMKMIKIKIVIITITIIVVIVITQ